MENIKKRDPYWDILKGIAIILVVLGHSIQFGASTEYVQNKLFFEDMTYKMIYGFHMPLFMFISGYFYYNSSAKGNTSELCAKIVRSLLIPIIVFSFIAKCLDCHQLSLSNVCCILVHAFTSSIMNLWFLWAVILGQIVVLLNQKYLKDKWWVYVLVIFVLYILPDPFRFAQIKFVLPFFIIGYYCRKNDYINSLFGRSNFVQICLLTCLYVFSIVLLYNHDTFVYTTKISLLAASDRWYQLYCDLLRFLIGLLGSISVVMLVNYFQIYIMGGGKKVSAAYRNFFNGYLLHSGHTRYKNTPIKLHERVAKCSQFLCSRIYD